MRLTAKQKQTTWKKACRMAFWDQQNYAYSAWRRLILNNDKRTIIHSIQYMKPIDFIRLVGIDFFVEHWAAWRFFCNDKKIQINCILLDALWSDYVMGDALVKPNDDFMSLTKKQKETYKVAFQCPVSLSMYELAKLAKRHYRRVRDDINILVEKRLFKKERSKRNNRIVDLISISR